VREQRLFGERQYEDLLQGKTTDVLGNPGDSDSAGDSSRDRHSA